MESGPVEVLAGGMQCTAKYSVALGADGASLDGTCSGGSINAETVLVHNIMKVITGHNQLPVMSVLGYPDAACGCATFRALEGVPQLRFCRATVRHNCATSCCRCCPIMSCHLYVCAQRCV